jgi:phage head maturation protease
MSFDKTMHPDCVEGPFGLPFKEEIARQVEATLKAHPNKGDAILKLSGSADVTVENDRMEVSKITTEAVDRDREVVVAKGIDLTAFQSNPVVLLNHDWQSLPLGKALWVKSHGAGLTAKTQYAKRPAEHGGEWLPDSVYSLIKQDMLPGKSIGFIPLEARPPEKAEIAARPELKDVRRIIPKSILLEYSVVGVPSNPEALVQMKAFPALALLLGVKDASVQDDGPAALTREEFQAGMAELRKMFPTWDEFREQLKDLEAVKIAIRSIRKDLLREPPSVRPNNPTTVTADDLLLAVRKIFPAA